MASIVRPLRNHHDFVRLGLGETSAAASDSESEEGSFLPDDSDSERTLRFGETLSPDAISAGAGDTEGTSGKNPQSPGWILYEDSVASRT